MYIHGVAKSQKQLSNSHWTNWTEYKKKTTQGRRKVNNNQIGKGSKNLKNYSTSEFPCPFLNSTAQLWPNSQNSTAETHTKNAERNFLILATGLGKRKSQSKPKSTRYIFPLEFGHIFLVFLYDRSFSTVSWTLCQLYCADSGSC